MFRTTLLLRMLAFAAVFCVVGCGGGAGGSRSANATGFDNQTKGLATDARLLELWHNAPLALLPHPSASIPSPYY